MNRTLRPFSRQPWDTPPPHREEGVLSHLALDVSTCPKLSQRFPNILKSKDNVWDTGRGVVSRSVPEGTWCVGQGMSQSYRLVTTPLPEWCEEDATHRQRHLNSGALGHFSPAPDCRECPPAGLIRPCCKNATVPTRRPFRELPEVTELGSPFPIHTERRQVAGYPFAGPPPRRRPLERGWPSPALQGSPLADVAPPQHRPAGPPFLNLTLIGD
jgi:hypothetical protein